MSAKERRKKLINALDEGMVEGEAAAFVLKHLDQTEELIKQGRLLSRSINEEAKKIFMSVGASSETDKELLLIKNAAICHMSNLLNLLRQTNKVMERGRAQPILSHNSASQ